METILVGLIPGAVIGVIGFFLVKTLKDIETKLTKNELDTEKLGDKLDEFYIDTTQKITQVEKEVNSKVDTLCKELAEHKETVQKDFVTKLDFARTTGEISKKLDKIQDYLMQLLKDWRPKT